MCVREYEFQIPYGVIETNGANLVNIKEKPIHRSFINAGIYVLSPEVLDFIPQSEFYDMPTLFEQLMARGKKQQDFQFMNTGWILGRWMIFIGRMKSLGG